MPPGQRRKIQRRLPGTYTVHRKHPGMSQRSIVVGASVFSDLLATGKKVATKTLTALKPALPVLKTVLKTVGKEGLKLLPELVNLLADSTKAEIAKGNNKTANKFLTNVVDNLSTKTKSSISDKGEDVLNSLIGSGLRGGALVHY